MRFDVYIKNQTGVTYIVELQRRDTLELPKRARYYQAMSDSRQLPKGKAHKYSDLKDNYVIFICLKDISVTAISNTHLKILVVKLKV